ncbi:MAG TPA: protein kinase [Pyrinomonadaceae bacterium]
MPIAPGTQLGRYEVRSQLGAGGMGEVYLAQDSRLERTVALKILPAEVSSDQGRMRRFVQEARAASALNHPNVAHIYEIEETDGHHFIAMEYIEGETLRQHAAHAQPSLPEALDISMQVAAALSAAHQIGIVHRDIKPENIMVRNDGYVKVLDFGLAKLTERPTAADTEAPTKALVNTDPGAVMGTVAYMSPEQARGQIVDARTDIWSLGVVLYEMVAGRAPFEGATTGDVITAILSKEPPLLARYVREVPEALEWIVTKALTKDKEERYQTAKEMLVDLRRLKQRLDMAAEIERSTPPDFASREMMKRSAEPTVELAQQPAAQTVPVQAAHTASSAEYLVGEIKRHKTGLIIALAALVVAIVGSIIVISKFGGRSSDQNSSQSAQTANPKTAPARDMKITRLTTSGKISNAAISPDGKYVVYAMREGGQESLWMRQVATGSIVQIVAPTEATIGRQTFSPDGNYVYYIIREQSNPSGALYQVPVLGGTPRKILVNIGSPIAFSPDGSRITFVRNDTVASGEDQLMVANSDGTNERKLAARSVDKFFDYGGPGWSPDGRVIACGAGSYSGGFHLLIVVVDAETGEQREFSSQKYSDTGRISWLADGSAMVMNASDQNSYWNQVWLISYPGGDARLITHDLNSYGGTSLTADSKSLVSVQWDLTFNIWVAPIGDMSHGKQVTSGKYEGGYDSLAWTPDNKIVYISQASGNQDIWIMNADGSNPRQLTNAPEGDETPTVTPDGRYIVFVSLRGGFPSLWRMDIDGANLKQLTNNQEDYWPETTPDGQWIFFHSWRTGKLALWKISIDGGEPVQVSDLFINRTGISPDGKLLACFYNDEKPNSPRKLIILPIEGGAPLKTFDLPPTVSTGSHPIWTQDGKAITFLDTRTGTSNLFSQPLDGGTIKQLTDFKPDSLWGLAVSKDGKSIALTRGTQRSDVVLITDFR